MIARKARFRGAKKIEKSIGFRIPDHAFNGIFLDVVSSSLNVENLDRGLRTQLLNFFRDFLDCQCRDSPACGCPEKKFTVEILQLRQTGLDHRQIAEYLLDTYGIELYPADILSFLEDSVHMLEAIRDVAELERKGAVMKAAEESIKAIEG